VSQSFCSATCVMRSDRAQFFPHFLYLSFRLTILVEEDGRLLADQLRQELANCANEREAVKDFLKKNASMREFAKKYKFFPSMLSQLSHRIVSQLTPLQTFDCIKKSVSSVADGGSDIGSALIYIAGGDVATGGALLGIFFVSMLVQLLLVVIQHRKNPRKMEILMEVGLSVSFMRPGVLHRRILTKQPLQGHESFDLISESTAARVSHNN